MVSKKEAVVLGAVAIAGTGVGLMILGKDKDDNGGNGEVYNPLEGLREFLADLLGTPGSGVKPDPDPYAETPPEEAPTLVIEEAPPMVKKYVSDPAFEKIIQHPSGSREIVLTYGLSTPAQEKYIRSEQFSEIVTHAGGKKEIILTGGGRGASGRRSSQPVTYAAIPGGGQRVVRGSRSTTRTKKQPSSGGFRATAGGGQTAI